MNGCRKVIGLFIVIFIGLPTLFAAIWGVGLTRAVVSPEFLSDLPRELIEKVPRLMDEALELAAREGDFEDNRTRKWVQAFADAETSPRGLLENIGVIDWLNNEVTNAFDDLGKMLKGERRPRPIRLNLRPLKQALKHEGIKEYIKQVLEKLPKCDTEQTAVWVDAAVDGASGHKLPACQPPEFDKALDIVRAFWVFKVDDIPDEVELIEINPHEDFLPFAGLDIARIATTLSYFLFLLPAFFILLGSWIGGVTGQKTLRWSGVTTLIGGLAALALAKFTGTVVNWATNVGHVRFSDYPLDEVGEVFAEKVGDLVVLITDRLFGTVNTVAGTVCIIGIILIALSYAYTSPRRTQAPHSNGGNQPNNNGPGTPGPQPSSPTPDNHSPAPQPYRGSAAQIETVDAVPIDTSESPAVKPPQPSSPEIKDNGATPLKPGSDS